VLFERAGMKIVQHREAAAFDSVAGPLLRSDPLRHTVALTVLDGLCRGGDEAIALLTVHDGGGPIGALLRTPGQAALVSALPPACAVAVDEALAALDPHVPGASGPVAEVEAFAAARAARTGDRVEVRQRTRLFVLDALVAPVGVPGAARRAGRGDVDVLAEWRHAFAVEDNGSWNQFASPRDVVDLSLRLGSGEMLWEVDGVPVAQASARPVVAGMSRVGPVYTPPEHRRHGYAAAVTAAASQWALDQGARLVVLFTDLANPTTNRLYPRIGYRPVHDAAEVGFTG
jgi:GNAT superfamily N-acetyltransferase